MPDKTRLTAHDWIAAGFRALVTEGPEALKAEPLARVLGTTKGSFYWHFKDVPDFRARMLAHWRDAAREAIQRAMDTPGTPTQKLYNLAELTATKPVGGGGAALEPAIRAWAQAQSDVREVVEEIDAIRLAYISAILKALDLTNPDFARIIYGAFIGMDTLSASDGGDNRDALSTLMAAILVLQDA